MEITKVGMCAVEMRWKLGDNTCDGRLVGMETCCVVITNSCCIPVHGLSFVARCLI